MNKLSVLLALILCSVITSRFNTAFAQGTAFTYQGQLSSGTNAANGSYDFEFALFNATNGGSQIGGTVTNLDIGVTNGLFITTLNFSNVFNGESAWLAISVRSNGTGSYMALTPLQPITPTPYAVYAESANATNLVGTIPAGNLSGAALLAGGNTFTGNQIVSSGNVGIGTNAPVKELELAGTVAAVSPGSSIDPSILFRLDNLATDGNTSSVDFAGIGFGNNSTRQAIVGGTYGNDYLDFYTGGLLTTPKMRINFGGSVGIGTTNPAATLEVNGTAKIDGVLTASSFSGSGSGLTGLTAANVSGVALLAGGNTFNGTQNVTNGSVGIGTTSPVAALDVAGSGWFRTNANGLAASAGKGVRVFVDTQNTNGSIFAYDYANGGPLNLALQAPGGKVGIGTETPTENLTIAGVTAFNTGLKLTGSTANGTGVAIENTASGGHKFDLVSGGANLVEGAGAFVLYDETANGIRMTVTPGGNVGVGTTEPVNLLDVNGSADVAGTLAVGEAIVATHGTVDIEGSAGSTSLPQRKTRLPRCMRRELSSLAVFSWPSRTSASRISSGIRIRRATSPRCSALR